MQINVDSAHVGHSSANECRFSSCGTQKHGSESPCTSSAKKKYAAKYKLEWATDLQFIIICHSDKGPTFAYCRV